ncbi:hypothetical protein RO21_07180 [[Actinobacillus] muris]|uniref:Uncharacterized protein n=1 Tax=Muribacter muris TaxID=67855 RepID=A0A0J5P4L6_9PAST|nr:hypothetical protein [Muribacter muris]KMK51241.1 hypothetical protein RO21_07180 [[Actinobacillus] muris] [Muribacter muris]
MRKSLQPVQNNRLHPFAFFGYPAHAMAKSIAEPRNSTDKSLANSTPTACFLFVAHAHPKNAEKVLNFTSVILW